MLRRRILYLVCFTGCFGFYIAYRDWMAWLFLLIVSLLPWFSLLISLPSMLKIRLSMPQDEKIKLGELTTLHLKMRSVMPAPPLGWTFCVTSAYGSKPQNMKRENVFYAEHCGCYCIKIKRGYKYDYLGLFRLRFGRKLQQKIYVVPKPIEVRNIPSLKRYLTAIWRPKPESFSENYDLRAYREGDSLRQIHWKLSSKTGKYILREPLVPQRGLLALSIILGGSDDEIDRKLGRLLYLSQNFLSKELIHEIHCLTGSGVRVFAITNEQELRKAMLSVLELPLSKDTEMPPVQAAWHYHIGGEADEA